MALQSINPTQTKSWTKLKAHFEQIKDAHMKTWFGQFINQTQTNKFDVLKELVDEAASN